MPTSAVSRQKDKNYSQGAPWVKKSEPDCSPTCCSTQKLPGLPSTLNSAPGRAPPPRWAGLGVTLRLAGLRAAGPAWSPALRQVAD